MTLGVPGYIPEHDSGGTRVTTRVGDILWGYPGTYYVCLCGYPVTYPSMTEDTYQSMTLGVPGYLPEKGILWGYPDTYYVWLRAYPGTYPSMTNTTSFGTWVPRRIILYEKNVEK